MAPKKLWRIRIRILLLQLPLPPLQMLYWIWVHILVLEFCLAYWCYCPPPLRNHPLAVRWFKPGTFKDFRLKSKHSSCTTVSANSAASGYCLTWMFQLTAYLKRFKYYCHNHCQRDYNCDCHSDCHNDCHSNCHCSLTRSQGPRTSRQVHQPVHQEKSDGRVPEASFAPRLTTLIIFWQNTLPANIRKWVFSWNKTWRNYVTELHFCMEFMIRVHQHVAMQWRHLLNWPLMRRIWTTGLW